MLTRWWYSRPRPLGKVAAGAAGLLAVGAFVGGRASVQPRVEVREVERVRTVEVVREVKVAAEQRQVDARRTVRREITQPDGTKIAEVEVSTATEIARRDERTETAARKEAARELAVTVTAARPDWRVSISAGAVPSRFSLIQPLDMLRVGVGAERRILGPVFLGAGLAVAPSRPLEDLAVSLSLSVEF